MWRKGPDSGLGFGSSLQARGTPQHAASTLTYSWTVGLEERLGFQVHDGHLASTKAGSCAMTFAFRNICIRKRLQTQRQANGANGEECAKKNRDKWQIDSIGHVNMIDVRDCVTSCQIARSSGQRWSQNQIQILGFGLFWCTKMTNQKSTFKTQVCKTFSKTAATSQNTKQRDVMTFTCIILFFKVRWTCLQNNSNVFTRQLPPDSGLFCNASEYLLHSFAACALFPPGSGV